MKYNLLATTEKITMSSASSQLWMNLRAVGDPKPIVNKTRINGIIQASSSLDPIEAIFLMREHMRKEPERYNRLFRIMPILEWVNTKTDSIVKEVDFQKSRISDSDTFRVTIEKRRTNLRSLEVINSTAAVIDNVVDLKNPDWIVLIEILGDRTGVSIVKPESLFNIQKERAKLSSKVD